MAYADAVTIRLDDVTVAVVDSVTAVRVVMMGVNAGNGNSRRTIPTQD